MLVATRNSLDPAATLRDSGRDAADRSKHLRAGSLSGKWHQATHQNSEHGQAGGHLQLRTGSGSASLAVPLAGPEVAAGLRLGQGHQATSIGGEDLSAGRQELQHCCRCRRRWGRSAAAGEGAGAAPAVGGYGLLRFGAKAGLAGYSSMRILFGQLHEGRVPTSHCAPASKRLGGHIRQGRQPQRESSHCRRRRASHCHGESHQPGGRRRPRAQLAHRHAAIRLDAVQLLQWIQQLGLATASSWDGRVLHHHLIVLVVVTSQEQQQQE